MRWIARIVVTLVLAAVAHAQTDKPAPKTSMPYAEAKPLLETFRDLPPELTAKTPAELESIWPHWVSRHSAEIRARVERGDEDAIVNLWLFGTTFTKRPLATAPGLSEVDVTKIVQQRLDDLVAGVASPGRNERLRFAREVVERKGISPATPMGRDQLRRYLVEARQRVLAEFAGYVRTRDSAAPHDDRTDLTARATIFHDRGLSPDTSILPNFGIERALEALMSQGMFGASSIRRVGIVGPGLDFVDFYPEQTIQPFAIIDSLIRLGLASPNDLRVTTFDVSPRVNQHLEAARRRAGGGGGYVLHFALHGNERWDPDLVKYWGRLGGRIGDEMEPVATPATLGRVDIRAVRVRPAVVLSMVPRDLNIVLERLDSLHAQERFDLIVATNILLYYGPFEQALALANVASMLRPGGFLLSNNAVLPMPPMASPGSTRVAYWPDHGDTIFWYRRN